MEQRANNHHELLLAQAGWVRGLAGSLVRDPLGAEDVAQETLLAALAAPPLRMDDERTLRAWLARVVTNLARLAARGNVRRRAREQDAARPEQVASVGETVERASQLRRVVDAVLALDEPYRSTVLLRFFEGLDSAEIGRRMGASPAAVRKRLSRGLERLREGLDAEYGGEREAWRAALLPLSLDPLWRGAGAGAPASAGAGALAGGVPAGWQAAAALWLALSLVGLSVLVIASQPNGGPGRAAAPGSPLASAAPGPAGAGASGRRVAPRAGERQPARPLRAPEDPIRGGEDAPPPRNERPASVPLPVPEAPRLAGRVLGLDGVGIGGVQVVPAAGGAAVATTAPDGSFELDLERFPGAAGGELAVAAHDLATVRTAAVEAAGPGRSARGLVVLAGPAIDLGGWVQDALGAPVPGARLELEVPDSAFADLWVPLEGTRPVPRAAEARGGGRFDFASLPTHPEFRLRVSAAGHGELSLPLPPWTTRDWSIRLPGQARPEPWFEGLVLLPGGRPAAGAEVRAGPYRTQADRAGRYRLPFDPADPAPTVVAELEGWRPAWETLSEASLSTAATVGGAGAGGGVGGRGAAAAHVLQIEGKLLSIAGVAFTPAGFPAAGWEVVALDDGTDPRHPERPPGGVAGSTVSAADGSFVLGGLLDHGYRVLAVDPATGLQAGPEPVAAGSAANLVARPERPARSGRVTSPSGAGLSGAVVTRALSAAGGAVAVGPSVLSGDDGTFHLPGAAGLEGALLVAHPSALVPTWSVAAQAEVAADAWFLFTGGPWDPAPEALAALDAADRPLELHLPSGPVQRLPLQRGRGPVVRVAETARTLVLYRGGLEIERLPLDLVAGELTPVPGLAPAPAETSPGKSVTPAAARQL